MNLYGFTDSLATTARQPNKCTNGHSASRVSDGLCLGCLLQAGLTEDEDYGSESLGVLLSEIEILGHQPASQEILEEEIGRDGCDLPCEPTQSQPVGPAESPPDWHFAGKFSHPVKYSRPSPFSFRRSKHAGD